MKRKSAYVLADKKLALNAGWDEDLLAEELSDLLAIDLDFDVGVAGFSIAEINMLVEDQIPQEDSDPADDLLPQSFDVSARCKAGDVWKLGAHRLVCGDALDPKVIDLLMEGETARMGTFYRSRHELIFAFKNGTAAHVNTFALGQYGRCRTNVWEYRGANSRHAGRMEEQRALLNEETALPVPYMLPLKMPPNLLQQFLLALSSILRP